ncbi:CACTA en-spm transposon protein [Cucumis melo var. makuwa]|uniref:CACTA en-spm transposon protein n=1 Tax=Cucumis melo var. makuwa TaxID=1194695 RepID=A0A5A7UJN1_CUCMM|nr:CACTA en-spm transposon protein [Cucumis melo var. makuwa]
MVIGESDASGTSDNNFYGVLDEVLHVQYPLKEMYGYLSVGVIMSYRRNNFMETDDMFLEFEDDLDNIAGGLSSVGGNTVSTLGVRAPRCNKWAHPDDDYPWSGKAYFPTRRSLQPSDRRVRLKDIFCPLS